MNGTSAWLRCYGAMILKRPLFVFICLCVLVLSIGYHTRYFRLDASTETLVLENDADLKFSRLVSERYGVSDFLILTYTPESDLFSDESLNKLYALQKELMQLDAVTSVFSILNTPLLENKDVSLAELADNIVTLESVGVDKNRAQMELRQSPLYSNLLASSDLTSTALLVYLREDKTFSDLQARRNHLREQATEGQLSVAETAEYEAVSRSFKQHRDKMRRERHEIITQIRQIMNRHRCCAQLFLGGISMIADDMVSFIKQDLKRFGLGVFCFLIVMLGGIFRKPRWIVLPMACCLFSTVAMMGLLGFFGWEVTVISSNFISLQLIITMAIAIHLVVQYRELHAKHPETDHKELILEAIRLKIVPCLYAALTTIAGFASLLICDILPVITFGWMMTAGIIVSLVLTFLLLPSGLAIIKKDQPPELKDRAHVLTFLAVVTETRGKWIIVAAGGLFLLSCIGITRLEVENSFIDYFKASTEIHQGMKFIDRNFGGTTPLDVVIDVNGSESEAAPIVTEVAVEEKDVFDEFDEFSEFDEPESTEKYWFTPGRMALCVKVHDYLENLPETGKVLSLGTMLKLAERLNDGTQLDTFELALLYNEIPESYKNLMVKPFLSIPDSQLRFSVRVRDSEKTMRRNAFLEKIKFDLTHELGIKNEDVHVTGMLVLYNNMLQSLFRSQILTLGLVLAALLVMFLILFRSVKIALIALFPNMLSVAVVLGIMGWCSIPLDMMTITIAAISIGIAVDNTIHYIHRFKREFEIDGDYRQAIHRSHHSIGFAMYYTSITVIAGFSILVLSNFIPSIYFGFLTGIAMLIALIASLTLLPQLMKVFKVFG
ncbi:MAG: RND family transporter [Deltaproteobacteria bacterium]|nr:RND family transporter [Deltaproteobacteria bacterium]